MLVRPSRPAMRDGREELLLEACREERTATRMCASLGLRLFLGGRRGFRRSCQSSYFYAVEGSRYAFSVSLSPFLCRIQYTCCATLR
ncbi:hypothetical protein M431DRAFT_260153 [Trichoderma harzianum CBS 226.95]|uniref:Uncharacterized protein n=1 Tax=Trichoderma harzianum CBS 226.95 TaxID=983964 RepID=A0A2T3ZZ35_TRIHA|nr:hypothetical protein M431DRAFT_260153 [Trichoderma harzianum CBS 226.95]PTB50070.1 hypothetical protein M431DRAFT_260153 [Trichoderma harzianum CBS 226.95]